MECPADPLNPNVGTMLIMTLCWWFELSYDNLTVIDDASVCPGLESPIASLWARTSPLSWCKLSPPSPSQRRSLLEVIIISISIIISIIIIIIVIVITITITIIIIIIIIRIINIISIIIIIMLNTFNFFLRSFCLEEISFRESKTRWSRRTENIKQIHINDHWSLIMMKMLHWI